MFRFSPLFGSYWIVLAIVFALGFLILRIKPVGERLPPKYGQRTLLVLRFIALALLLFGLLQPTLVYTKEQRLASTVILLVDRSESMSRPDEIGGTTRFQAAQAALLEAAPQLKRLQDRSDVQCFAFDAALHPLTLDKGIVGGLPARPEGRETAIGYALDTVRERFPGKRVLATILLSDGTQRTRPPRDILPHDAAARLRDVGMPLYAVALGQPSGTPDVQDISVNEIQANDRVFVRNSLLITGSLRISGYRNQPIPVRLYFEDESGEMQFASEVTVQSPGDGQIVPFRLSHVPEKVGYYKYTVQVPPQPKELIDTNNQQSNFVRVIDGGLRVLYLQGERNFEQRLLCQSLDASTDIQVDYHPIRVGKIGAGAKGRDSIQLRLERFTEQRADWTDELFAPGKYNVYILDSIDAKAFKSQELAALADRVRDGGAGLIMLGGFNAFGAGGYADTPLAGIAPIEMKTLDRQPLDAPIRRDIHWPGPLQMIPRRQGRMHYVMRLESNPTRNDALWTKLPPLPGANRFDKLKPGATVLAEGPQEQLLLVSQLAGLGRVLAFAGDSTYLWRTSGFVEEHKRFWRQIVLWLAKMENMQDGDCWIVMDNVRLLPGETARFQVFMQSVEGDQLRGFQAEAVVRKPDGSEETLALVDEEGIPTGAFRTTDQPGDYTVSVRAVPQAFEGALPDELTPRETSARFMVFDRNLELDSPVAYPQLLHNISTLTGGKSVAPEQLGSLLDELLKQSDDLVERRETKRSLYDSWPLLLAFVGALGLEWFLRKYWGLV